MRAMEENEAEVTETANEFEIFDRVISIISSAAALTDGCHPTKRRRSMQ